MENQALASAIADLLNRSRDHLAAEIKKDLAPSVHPDALGVIDQWLEDQIAYFRGGTGHISEWLALLVARAQRSRSGASEIYSIIQSIRRNIHSVVSGKIEEATDAEVFRVVFEAEDRLLRLVVRMYDETLAKLAAAEQRRRKMITEASRHPFVIIDNDGALTLANSTFAKMLGVTEEYLTGRNFLTLCDSPTAAELRRELRQKRKIGARSMEGALVAQSGRIAVQMRLLPLYDEEGLREGLGMVLLVPELEEAAPVAQAKIIERIAGATKLAYYLVETAGRVVGANDAAFEYIRLGQMDNSQHCCKTIPLAQRQCEACLQQASAMGAVPYNHSMQVKLDNGENRWVEMTCVPLRGKEGGISHVAKLLRDVTEQKVIEYQLLHQQKTNRMTQLAVAVAHQLRNPLGIMIGFAEMLAKGVPPDQIPVMIEKILANGIRCKKVVEDLLELGKTVQEETELVDVNALIRQRVELVYENLDKKHLSLSLADNLGRVKCIPEQLALVLMHLVDLQLEGAREEVVVSTAGEGENILVSLSRDQPLDETERNLLFAPESPPIDGKSETATAIGLSRRLIEGIGARLSFDKDNQTAVNLQIPVYVELAKPSDAAAPTAKKMRKRTILVIEDEPDQAFLLKLALQSAGHDVDCATGTGDGINLISQKVYDAFVIDILLGEGLGGRDIYQFIQRYNAAWVDRSIFITGDTFKYETRRFLQEVNRPALEKPFLIGDLIAELNQVFEKTSAAK